MIHYIKRAVEMRYVINAAVGIVGDDQIIDDGRIQGPFVAQATWIWLDVNRERNQLFTFEEALYGTLALLRVCVPHAGMAV